jgi:hypothetical protein
MPKYTLVAPASIAAARLSQQPTGAIISIFVIIVIDRKNIATIGGAKVR